MMDGRRGRQDSGTLGDDVTPENLRRRRRSAWNPSSWTPATTSFSANPTYQQPRTRGGQRFASTEHLAPEAVAAFVDGELGMTAHVRATHHLTLCPECMSAVDAQLAARTRLRESGAVSVPDSLLGQLAEIPTREIDLSEIRADHRAGRGRPAQQPPMSFPAGLPPVDVPGTRGRMNRWRGR